MGLMSLATNLYEGYIDKETKQVIFNFTKNEKIMKKFRKIKKKLNFISGRTK